MVNNKKSEELTRSTQSNQKEIGFFKRFSFIFECIFIVLLTFTGLLLTRALNLPEQLVILSDSFQDLEFSTLIININIIGLSVLITLIRYSLYLRKKMQQQFITAEEIKRLAFFDNLTHLPNQELGHDRLEHALARAARNNTSVAVLSIGIGNFKAANDQIGHEGGDKLIKQIAKRLSAELRSGDTLARVSGVEFIIVLENIEKKDSLNAFAEKLLSKVAKCYRISMREIYVTSNMGIAIYPMDGEYSKALIKHADTSMRFAKEQGRNRLAFFSKALQAEIDVKKEIAEQLRNAMVKKEFILHYQPIISAQTNKIIAVEALLRWQNKLVGDLSPSVFIPIAEEIGLIADIGNWVLSQACEQNKKWQQQGYTDLMMTINLSVVQLSLMNYASTISSALEKSGLSPQYLELEFTENSLMKDAKQSRSQLRALGDLGVSIALDDFGTGFSSMKYLSTFRLNKLKIDGSFITNIPDNNANVMAVKGIISLAKELGLHITAEGVETRQQYDFLSLNKVDSMQGFYFSHPTGSAELEQLLKFAPWQNNSSDMSSSKLVS